MLLLIAGGDHPERLRSEAAWAHLWAVAPIPASSGKTVRHRLNPGGDRQANHALWRIVITRMTPLPWLATQEIQLAVIIVSVSPDSSC